MAHVSVPRAMACSVWSHSIQDGRGVSHFFPCRNGDLSVTRVTTLLTDQTNSAQNVFGRPTNLLSGIMVGKILFEERLGVEVQCAANVDSFHKRQQPFSGFVLANEGLRLPEYGRQRRLCESPLLPCLAKEPSQMFFVCGIPVLLIDRNIEYV